MKKIFSFLLILLAVSNSKAASGTKEDFILVKETPNSVVENSSEHLRSKKQFQISAQLFGVGPIPGFNSGVNFGYFLDRNSMIQMNVSKLGLSMSCSGDLICAHTGRSIGGYYKRFLSNSFYMSAGLDFRQVSYSEELVDPFWGYNFSFDAQSTALGIVIGNQWQWENFTLGCDWIGTSVPLSHQIKNETISGINPSEGALSLEDKENTYAKNSAALGIRFYLGASF